MSVAELQPVGGADFARTPPQDLYAEQCVIGGMLLSKDAIADVVEVLRPGDFYRPAHQVLFDTVIDLYGRGEPADAVTVAAELTKHGEIARVGGADYLHTLMALVPVAANAGFYARIVHERAILRRLVEAGSRITQMAFTGDAEVDDIVDRAQAEVYAVTERRTGDDYLRLGEVLPATLDEIEAISTRGGAIFGVPTGFVELDQLTNGLHPGQMIILAARPAIGKALALDTPLPTPDGWTTMGEVRTGDQLLSADGRPTTVVATTDAMYGRPCYRVEFSDGTSIVADAQHQWLTDTRASRRSAQRARDRRDRYQRTLAAVRTTEEIAATLRCSTADRRFNHSVASARPLDLSDRELAVPPYTLGVWLGDGSARDRALSTEHEIAWHVEADGFEARQADVGCSYQLRRTGGRPLTVRQRQTLDGTDVPAEYLRSSQRQRRALLAGLLDTDGTVTRTGAVQFACTRARLAADVHELVVSLGYRCGVSSAEPIVTNSTRKEPVFAGQKAPSRRAASDPIGKSVRARTTQSSTCWTLTFTTTDEVFQLERKRLMHKERTRTTCHRTDARYITAVTPTASVPVRCVRVDNPDQLYLASRSMVPTHNSTLALDFARAAAVKHSLSTVLFSLEMSRSEITMRLLSAEAKVALHAMRSGTLSDDDWTRLARRMSEVSEAPLYIDDSPNLTMMEIRAKARRLKQQHDLRMVIVDYMQLMQSPRRVESRQQEVSEISRSMKLLAKEIDVPVIAISQLNRGPEQRGDKKPQLSDLRESGCLTVGTRLMRADTGAEVALGELLASGARNVPVWSLDERLKLVPRTMTHVFPSGTREAFRLRLASGRLVEATANHPFLTLDGWRPLGELEPGSRIAVLRHVPPPLEVREWPDDEVVLLAHLLGDGSFVRRQPIRYASRDEANLAAVTDAARHFGITAVRDDYAAARVTTLRLPAPYRLARGKRNPIAAWLDGLGLFGLRSHEKFVPAGVFGLPKHQVALFLRHLWATDGSVRWDGTANQARLYYATTSRRLADDIARLLLRFNVVSRIKRVRKAGYRDGYHLYVYGVDNQLRYLTEIGVHGARGAVAALVADRLRGVRPNTNLDTVPVEVWDRVRDALREKHMSHRQFAAAMGTQFSGSALWKHAPSRSRLGRVAMVLGDAELDVLATNDVFWDAVASVESIGEQQVFDATVMGTHNFAANGIAVHNSLEQDADMVVLLHREDAYERESPRAGEADLIVAKHRNGPTKTVTVAFQGHYSRFVDMAPV